MKAQTAGGELPAGLLMAFVFGLYLGAFLGHRLTEALQFNIDCVEEAYQQAKASKEEANKNAQQPVAADP